MWRSSCVFPFSFLTHAFTQSLLGLCAFCHLFASPVQSVRLASAWRSVAELQRKCNRQNRQLQVIKLSICNLDECVRHDGMTVLFFFLLVLLLFLVCIHVSFLYNAHPTSRKYIKLLHARKLFILKLARPCMPPCYIWAEVHCSLS